MDKINPSLTVFTPTYNRAKLLTRGYEALCHQTCHDFCWLIIDDGSIDNTRQVVDSWMDKITKKNVVGGFEGNSVDAPWLHIRYCYKENGGLHTGYNTAIELMDSEICVCIDSDDYASEDMADFIIKFWAGHKNNPGVAGIIGLDYCIDGTPSAGLLPEVDRIKIIDIHQKYHYSGDTKIVMRVDLLKLLQPQPTYNGEKNFNPIFLLLQLDFGHYFIPTNHNLCYVDYQDTGMAANIFKQFVNSPNSFAALRSLYVSLPDANWKFKLRNLVHLSSSAFLAKDLSWLYKCKYPMLAWMLSPIGLLLSLYVKCKAK